MLKAPQLIPYHFKKGTSGNPEGARSYHNRRRAVREISNECLARISEALFDGDVPSLLALAQADDVTPIEKLCIGVVAKAWEKGDAQALGMLMDRFVGKPKERIEVRAEKTTPLEPSISEISDDELLKRRALLDEAEK